MKTITTLIALVMALSATASIDSTGKKIRPFQLTFISPIGTNGLESGKIINGLSVNMLAGYSGGLKGVEFGGFANVVKGEVDGVQFAGFGNSVIGEVKGGQFAGFYNVNSDYTVGLQAAGFVNMVADSADALQFAGFTNVTSSNFRGMQASGFLNTVGGDMDGAQFSGFANVAGGDVTGTQVSGFLNVGRKLRGVQLGVFNYCDSVVSGTPIGFFSFVKNGYHRFEIGGNEVLWANAAFKTGSDKFYNIFAAGTHFGNDELTWAVGYGIGGLIPLKDRFKLSVDAIGYQINESDWTDGINLLSRLNISLDYAVSDKLSVFGGPAYNVMVSRIEENEGIYTYSDLAPYHHYNNTNSDGVNVKMWVGFNAGIRF